MRSMLLLVVTLLVLGTPTLAAARPPTDSADGPAPNLELMLPSTPTGAPYTSWMNDPETSTMILLVAVGSTASLLLTCYGVAVLLDVTEANAPLSSIGLEDRAAQMVSGGVLTGVGVLGMATGAFIMWTAFE